MTRAERRDRVRLARLAKDLAAKPITEQTYLQRFELVLQESLAARLSRARLDGRQRAVSRLEKEIGGLARRVS